MSHLSRFHLLHRSAQESGDDQTRELLQKLGAEIKEHLGGSAATNQEYFKEVVATLRAMQGQAHATLRVGCLLDCCQFFYITGQPFLAIDPATDAIELARASGSLQLLRRALNGLGIVSADTGNVSKAIECYAEAMEIAERIGDRDALCATWGNLGVAWLYAAQYQDAIACCERVLVLSEGDPALKKHRASAYANIALACLHIEDLDRGLKAAKASIEESPEPKSSGDLLARVLRENNYARLLLEIDDIDHARERLSLARKFAQLSRSARAEIVAAVVDGLCEVQAGNVDVGLSRLLTTLEKARLLKATLRDALIATVKAYQLIGQPEKALIYLRELIDFNKLAQQASALQHNALHLERLGRTHANDHISTRTMEKKEAVLREQLAQKELIRKEAEAELAVAEKDKARRDLFRSRIEMLERMAVTAELRDDSTGEHSYRVGKLASLLAQEFGCDEETCFMIDLAARLHDIGKIGVPDAVLLKPGKLNDAELQVMRSHPIVGAELLSKSDTPHVQMAEEIARFHHEWWDGTGYPGNLSGSAIPLSARITALADVFDALTHKRPYKDAWSLDDAMAEISRQSGTQFDPHLTELFVVLVNRLRAEHTDLDAFLGQAANATPFMQARAKIQHALQRRPGDETGSGSRLDLQR